MIVHIDSVPNGQGHRTVMAQVVADEIGVLPEDVEVVSDLDTFGGAWSITSGNYSNRFSTVVTSAAKLAGQQAARKLRAAAAKELGVDPDQVQLVNGMASAPGGKNEPSRSAGWRCSCIGTRATFRTALMGRFQN